MVSREIITYLCRLSQLELSEREAREVCNPA